MSKALMAEFACVLERSFGFDEQTVLDAVASLLAAEGADFADALIKDTADLFGCEEVVTFDGVRSGRSGFVCWPDWTRSVS